MENTNGLQMSSWYATHVQQDIKDWLQSDEASKASGELLQSANEVAMESMIVAKSARNHGKMQPNGLMLKLTPDSMLVLTSKYAKFGRLLTALRNDGPGNLEIKNGDYRHPIWNEECIPCNAKQAAVIERLAEYEGGPMADDALRLAAMPDESVPGRLRAIFMSGSKPHKAWGTIVVPGEQPRTRVIPGKILRTFE